MAADALWQPDEEEPARDDALWRGHTAEQVLDEGKQYKEVIVTYADGAWERVMVEMAPGEARELEWRATINNLETMPELIEQLTGDPDDLERLRYLAELVLGRVHRLYAQERDAFRS